MAVYQAADINKLIHMSTGTKSAIKSLWHSSVLRTPLPAPASRPVGPFKLSTQPNIGSLHDAVTAVRVSTKNKQTMS